MTRNQLTSLSFAPEYLQHVTQLRLNLNFINQISENFFKQLVNLKSLKLMMNKIEMAPNMFEHLRNLEELDLSYNDLGKLEPEWFTGLTKLRDLDFDSNNVTSFDYVLLLNTLPTLNILNIRGSNHFECSFLKKMKAYLKEEDRLGVLKYMNFPEEDERGNYIFGIQCDRHLKDHNGFTYSYLQGNYDF